MQFPLHARTCQAAIGLALIGPAVPAGVASADSVIQIALSVKRISDPFSGTGPQNFNAPAIASLNTLMEQYGRGYRFVLVDNGIRVGAAGGYSRPNPSAYYSINFASDTVAHSDLVHDARNNPALYAWNPQAVNIYVNAGTMDHVCAFANSFEAVVLGASDSHLNSIYLHELGHYFGLCNTQGCACICCTSGGDCGVPQGDGIADTLPDKSCWDQDQSAMFNFGVSYALLNLTQRARVDEAITNAMSIRGAPCALGFPQPLHFTEGQLDRWADVASTTRLAACDGRTFFVQAGATGTQTGRSTAPFDRVAEGLNIANSGGDIVMIRAGTYAETLRISTPVTLRTPRGQTARIGG